MNANNLTWEQIKELAEMAIENGSNFSIIGKHTKKYYICCAVLSCSVISDSLQPNGL